MRSMVNPKPREFSLSLPNSGPYAAPSPCTQPKKKKKKLFWYTKSLLVIICKNSTFPSVSSKQTTAVTLQQPCELLKYYCWCSTMCTRLMVHLLTKPNKCQDVYGVFFYLNVVAGVKVDTTLSMGSFHQAAATHKVFCRDETGTITTTLLLHDLTMNTHCFQSQSPWCHGLTWQEAKCHMATHTPLQWDWGEEKSKIYVLR